MGRLRTGFELDASLLDDLHQRLAVATHKAITFNGRTAQVSDELAHFNFRIRARGGARVTGLGRRHDEFPFSSPFAAARPSERG